MANARQPGKTGAPVARQSLRRPRRSGSTVRMGTVMAIPSLLQSLGVDPVEVLTEAGVDLTLFSDPEHRVSLAAHNRIVQHCADRTRCPHFGLLVGQQDGLQSLGLLGLLLKYSADVQSALESLVRHLRVQVQGARVSLVVEGNWAILGWEIHEPGVDAIDQVGDGAIAVYHNILGELCGANWKPTEAWFAHRRPANVAPFREFFKVPLRFDAEQFALVFPAAMLKLRLPEVDDQVRHLLHGEIKVLEQRHGDDFAQQVRSVLRTALLTGHLKADQVAGLFGMHSRTLHRRLSECGTGFQQLVDESRFAFARQLLQDSSMDLGEISELLGYAAPGVFTRAFHRWSGTTPAAWRAQRKVEVPRRK
jgi:AraC-like DNA-binding protein